MSEKEKIIRLLDNVPPHKLGYILAYIQGLTADEYSTPDYYENTPIQGKNISQTIEECKRTWGLN